MLMQRQKSAGRTLWDKGSSLHGQDSYIYTVTNECKHIELSPFILSDAIVDSTISPGDSVW